MTVRWQVKGAHLGKVILLWWGHGNGHMQHCVVTSARCMHHQVWGGKGTPAPSRMWGASGIVQALCKDELMLLLPWSEKQGSVI